MYEPKWPFLLMYGSHNMRHTSFLQVDRLSTDPRVDGLSTNPRDLGRYNINIALLLFCK